MTSFWGELKRRNVVRVAIAYAVVAWLAIEVSATTFPMLKLPEWAATLVTVLLMIGFPVALIFAWAFELTPEGLKKEKDVDRSESITHLTGRKLDFVIIGVLVVAVGFLLVDKLYLSEGDTAPDEIIATERQSIAVLPFMTLSSNQDDEYFSDGLTEELLNSLAQISGLNVAGRTSSFFYKGKTPSFQEVGEALGVAHVLEGSVRRAGNELRITTQLIKVDDGFHLWSATYDRTLDDIFAIQEDIAYRVTDALKVTLFGEEAESLRQHGTSNAEAQSLYLIAKARLREGHTFGSDSHLNREHLRSARRLLEETVRLDPDFAEAWAALARAYLMVIQFNLDDSGEGLSGTEGTSLAGEALQRALLLAPDLAEAYLAKAEHHWRNTWYTLIGLEASFGRVAASVSAFETALRLAPDNAEILEAFARMRFEQGEYETAISLYDQALAIDPFSLAQLRRAEALFWSGRGIEAVGAYREIGIRNPNVPWKLGIAEIEFDRGHLHHGVLWAADAPDILPLPFVLAALGDWERVGEIYRNLRRTGGAFADLLTVEELFVSRDYAGVERWFAEAADLTSFTPFFRRYYQWVAALYLRNWQEAAVRLDVLLNEFPVGRDEIWGSPALRKLAVDRPVQINIHDATVANYVAFSLDQVGRLEEAQAARRWADELIALKEPLTANQKFAVIHFRALRAASIGQKEQALAALEKLVDAGWRATMAFGIGGSMEPYYKGDLGWFEDSPLLDSIRDEPRFKAVVEKVNAANAAMLAEFDAGLTLEDIMDEDVD